MTHSYPYLPEGRTIKHVPLVDKFMSEAKKVRDQESADFLVPTGAVVVKDGKIVGRSANRTPLTNKKLLAAHKKGLCVRRMLKVRSGEKYWLCPGCASSRHHAESRAVKDALRHAHSIKGADLYMYGHWWCCRPCWDKMISAGIKDVYLVDGALDLFEKRAYMIPSNQSSKIRHKLVIGVDLDDVTFDFNNALHAYHNNKHGFSVAREDITSYNLEDVWGCTSEEVGKRLTEFFSAPDHDAVAPVAGSIEALTVLKDTHELHLITSRADRIRDLTLRWIDKNFPGYFKSVNLTNQSLGLAGKARSKAEVCRELGVDIMIEDSLSQVEDIASAVSRMFLLDCPWNQGKVPHNVIRVRTWADIIKQLS